MRKQAAIDHFGGVAQLAKVLTHCSPQAVSQWGDLIPLGRAYEIESLTERTLRVNKADYTTSSSPDAGH